MSRELKIRIQIRSTHDHGDGIVHQVQINKYMRVTRSDTSRERKCKFNYNAYMQKYLSSNIEYKSTFYDYTLQ